MTDYKKAGRLFCWGMVSLGLLLEILMNFLLVYIADWRVSEELMMCAWSCIAFVCMWQPLLALRFQQEKLFRWGTVLLAAQAGAMYAAYKQGSYAATMFCAGICAVLLAFSIMLLALTLRRQTPSAAA